MTSGWGRYAMKNLHRLPWKRHIRQMVIMVVRENICATLPRFFREVNTLPL